MTNQKPQVEAQREAALAAPDWSAFECGRILRIQVGQRYNVWKITGVFLGGVDTEGYATLRRLDVMPGDVYGRTVRESVVPIDILRTHLRIETP
jgi:hypothetical protein